MGTGSATARRFALALAVAAALPLASASHVFAAEVPDASCPGDPATNGSANGMDRLGQTFTALNTGQLTSATMSIAKLASDDAFSMQIRPLDGAEPGDDASAIATESVPAPASTSFVPITANFSTPASVVAGQQYALVLQRGFPFATLTSAVACEGDSWFTQPAGGDVWFAAPELVYSVFVISNSFEIGKAKLNKKKGTAKLPVSVPDVGTVLLGGSKVKPDSEDAQGAGVVDLTVKAKGKAKKKLNKKGKAKVKAKVTYTPEGGEPNTQSKQIKLKKR